MRETFVIRLKEACGISPGEHVLVAVSGGARVLVEFVNRFGGDFRSTAAQQQSKNQGEQKHE